MDANLYILYIEDERPVFELVRHALRSAGYEITGAANGRQGLALIRQQKPDLLLLDLMMPEMNGDEMLEKLRKSSWGKNIKVVILTNMGEAKIAEKVLEMDIAGFIVKAQSTPAQVVEHIKQILV